MKQEAIKKAYAEWHSKDHEACDRFEHWSKYNHNKQMQINKVESCVFDADREVSRVLRRNGLIVSKRKPASE